MNNKKILSLVLILFGIFWSNAVKAVCPVCVVAIGGGLEISRILGVDDVVSSIWIGAIIVATILWTLVEMKKHNWRFKFDTVIISLVYYLLIFVPLYYYNVVGLAHNKIFGIDKIIFGSVLGTIFFLLANWLHLYLKNKNGGKSFFPYQKVVVPIVVLLITSLIFYLLLIWKII